MNGRPHESFDCRCIACATYDENAVMHCYDLMWPDIDAALAAERAAWQTLISMCDAVFADDGIKTK